MAQIPAGFTELPQKAYSGTFASTGDWSLFAKLMVILALLFLAAASFVRLGLRGRTLRNPAWGPLLRDVVRHGLMLGAAGLLLGFFRYEQVLYLSGPWALDLYLIVCLVWLGWMGRRLSRIPSLLEQQQDLERKQQWISPKKKRKKRR